MRVDTGWDAALAEKTLQLQSLAELGMNSFLQAVADAARDLLHAAACGIVISNLDNPNYYDHFFVSGWRGPDRFPSGHGMFALPFKTGRPLRVARVAEDPRSVGTPADHPPIGALLAVPIGDGAMRLGSLFLTHGPSDGVFDQEDEERILEFAARVEPLLASARTCMRVQTRAERAERDRLAQRLHDSVAQTLFVLGQELIGLENVLGPEVSGEVLARIRSLQGLAGRATSEVRTTIFSMSDDTRLRASWHNSLQTLVEEFEKASRIKTELLVRGDPDILPPHLYSCVAKVVGESLVNVHRHSGSPMAVVSMGIDESQAMVSIQDIGRGISDSALEDLPGSAAHLGLRSMRAAVEDLGGTFYVGRNDEGGTTVRAQLPLLGRGS